MTLTIELPDEKDLRPSRRKRGREVCRQRNMPDRLRSRISHRNGFGNRGRVRRNPASISFRVMRLTRKSLPLERPVVTPGCNRAHDPGRSRREPSKIHHGAAIVFVCALKNRRNDHSHRA